MLFLLFATVAILLMVHAMLHNSPLMPSSDEQPPSDSHSDETVKLSKDDLFPIPYDDDSDYHTDSLELHDIQNFIKAKAQIVYNGRIYSIDTDHYIIGHDESCNLTVVEKSVSGYHCKIDYQDNTFMLADIDSKNGTYLNGKRVTKSAELHNGDEIRLGLVAVIFKRHSDDNNPHVLDVSDWNTPLEE